jgi:Domain of unknown function (DUF4129)
MWRPGPPASTILAVAAVAVALVAIGAAAGAGPLGGQRNTALEVAVGAGLVGVCAVVVLARLGAAIITRPRGSGIGTARQASTGPSLGLALAAMLLGAVIALLTAIPRQRHPAAVQVPEDPGTVGGGDAHATSAVTPWLALGVLAVLAIALIVGVTWMRLRVAPRRAGSSGLADVATRARHVLALPDDDRTAVLMAYARMEELLAGRRAMEAPREFLLRATAASGDDARRAATRLTSLFERARFDRSPISAGDRKQADAALDVLGREP